MNSRITYKPYVDSPSSKTDNSQFLITAIANGKGRKWETTPAVERIHIFLHNSK